MISSSNDECNSTSSDGSSSADLLEEGEFPCEIDFASTVVCTTTSEQTKVLRVTAAEYIRSWVLSEPHVSRIAIDTLFAAGLLVFLLYKIVVKYTS